MNEPLVSVVVSSYNRPLMLQTALRSVLGQSYSNLEIIVQDDSTNDECGQVVLDLADPRIRYTRNQPALGTISNLRAGYRKCTGKYFSTLNDDDVYGPDYIATVIQPLESDVRYVLAFADHYIIDQQGNVDEGVTNSNSVTFGRSVLQEGSVRQPLETGILAKSIPGMFAMFRRDAVDLGDFPNEVSSGYDYWLTYLALREGGAIYYNPQRLTYYRVHAGSQTSSFVSPEEGLRSLRYSEYMHLRFLADARLKSIHAALLPRLAQIYTSMGFNRLRIGSRSEAFQKFRASCKLKPTSRALAGLLLCAAPTAVLKKL
ncbi:MAG: glycosyl transferase [Acidobacteriaceae bacterium]|nr:glycosyl transferase [Acidobacteriaceae bacterium]